MFMVADDCCISFSWFPIIKVTQHFPKVTKQLFYLYSHEIARHVYWEIFQSALLSFKSNAVRKLVPLSTYKTLKIVLLLTSK